MSLLFRRCVILIILALSCPYIGRGQCAVPQGPPPPLEEFYTGTGNPGGPDKFWQISLDSLSYTPATLMEHLDPVYFLSYAWISFSSTGEHASNRYFWYKKSFDLPCNNPCGKSYNLDNSFCLNLALYADNSVYEIYVNGVPQSANLGNIPLVNPFNPLNHSQSDKTPIQLCNNWKAGPNELIIKIASSATVAGLMIYKLDTPPPPPDAFAIADTICEGDHYSFGTMDLTEPGSYSRVIHDPGGCDSNIVLKLAVTPIPRLNIDQTICEGESFFGHTQSGTYIDKYAAPGGCDSVRTIKLTVQSKPHPDLGNLKAICPGDTISLNPGAFNTYQWQDGSSGNTFAVKAPGLYGVTVTNSCGTGSAQIQIGGGLCEAFFPTAFTPNNDGLNDSFGILTHFQLEDYHLSIYNRYGQLVFETADPKKAWDGSYKGKAQASGVYAWRCYYRYQSVDHRTKGTVTLVQ